MAKKKEPTAPKPPDGPDLSTVTMQQLENKIQELHEQEQSVDEAKAELARRTKVSDNTKAWLCAFMAEHRKTSYPSTWGTLVRRVRTSYAVPKTTEERSTFFDFLRKRNVFEQMISVHSQTLNSWVKTESEAAAARGEFDFEVPGLGKPSTHEFVSLTRKGAKV